MRKFSSGAIRNDDKDKLDFEGFLCPKCLLIFAEYMHKHRFLETGEIRGSDNWQKGFAPGVNIKSGWRHLHDWWLEERGYPSRDGLIDALCGVVFNAFARLHEEHLDYGKKRTTKR
jgi:hypothetical protein